MYAKGEAVAPSNVLAHAWASIAGQNGEEKGRVLAEKLEPELTPNSLRFFERQRIRTFYDAALTTGAAGYEAPGIREQFHPQYFAASFYDPGGNNVEAVFIGP
jgi:hypothetical protein